MALSNSVRIELLNKENYDTWKIQMEALLIKNDAWGYVVGTEKKPDVIVGNAESVQAARKWDDEDRKAKSDIILSIHPTELKQIKNCVTSNEVWTKLKNIYQSRGPARKTTLLKKLTLQRMHDGEEIRDHLRTFFDTIDKLSEMEVEINLDLLTIMLLYSLPPSFENFRCAIESRDELPTPEALKIKIVEEADARKSDVRSTSSDAMVAKRQFDKRRNNYPRNSGNDGTNPEPFRYKCHRCGKIGHKAADCTESINKGNIAKQVENLSFLANEGRKEVEQRAFSGRFKSDRENWCLDSGCTSHLCKDTKNFSEIIEETKGTLNLASNASTEIKARGTAFFPSEFDGKSKNVDLQDTLHVPDLRTNLLSVGKIADKGFNILFSKDYATVIDSNGSTVLQADRIDGLYFLKEKKNICNSSTESERTPIENWHRKMGHLNVRDLVDSDKNGAIVGMKLSELRGNLECDVCLRGKMTKTPFPKKTERCSDSLEIVHSDVCGPMRVESNGKARYFVVFIDDFSRWCEVKMIKKKSEVFESFKEFKVLAETQTGKRIKHLQTDNGLEYMSKEFEDFLKNSGIKRRLTVTHTPQQNGVAERKNRTLVEMARCLLIQSSLPPSFWGEAVNTANYIRNRCPSKSIDGKTPFEKWTGKVPNVSHFREFGCEAFTLIREPGQGKFQSRSKQGIFVGYSELSKAYRVWIPEERRIDITRDIKFKDGLKTSLEPNYEDFIEIIDEDLGEREVEFPTRIFDFDRDEERNDQNEINNLENNNEAQDDENDDSENDEVHIDENNISENEDVRFNENAEENRPSSRTRGPGRPRKIKTGLRGRPRKEYQTVNNIEKDTESETTHECVVCLAEIPISEAVEGPDSNEWFQAMGAELKSIIKNDTWTFVDRPTNQQVVGSRVVLRNKYNSEGILEKRKARVVAKGFTQRPEIDFGETFAPVARLSSIRTLMTLAVEYEMNVQQFDVTTAYLNGILDETIYMEIPEYTEETLRQIICTERTSSKIGRKAQEMLRDLKEGNKVCLLKKALYGLRQAGRQWHIRLCEELKKFGLNQSKSDPCIFHMRHEENILLMAVYVDDILAASKSQTMITNLANHLSQSFEINDLGEVKYCLGIEFSRDGNDISMHQRGYINDVLDRFGMLESKSSATPLDLGTKLIKSEKSSVAGIYNLPYRELIGALMYLAVCSRPDIAYVVSYSSQFNSYYDESHWTAAKRVLRYLRGTSNVGLNFKKTGKPLLGYVDADWGNCINDRRSYTGFAFLLGGCVISWESRKQRTVALSSTEAEYMALTEAAKEAIYLQRLLNELGFNLLANAKILSDNCGAQKLAKNPIFHHRTKHIDIRHHFVREVIETGALNVEYIATDMMAADVLTKGLSGPKHRKCVELLGVRNI